MFEINQINFDSKKILSMNSHNESNHKLITHQAEKGKRW